MNVLRRSVPIKKRKIGLLELVSIPEWNLYNVRAKIDTGAFTSSIDVSRVVLLPSETGRPPRAQVFFGTGAERHAVITPVVGFRRVRNPSGNVTTRPIVEAKICLGGRRFRTTINLHHREGMTYRMIIGRKALFGRFVVDVDRRKRRRWKRMEAK